MPITPPNINKMQKYILVKLLHIGDNCSVIDSGISYQPSIVNRRKIEYIALVGVLKYSGDIFLNMAQRNIPMTS